MLEGSTAVETHTSQQIRGGLGTRKRCDIYMQTSSLVFPGNGYSRKNFASPSGTTPQASPWTPPRGRSTIGFVDFQAFPAGISPITKLLDVAIYRPFVISRLPSVHLKRDSWSIGVLEEPTATGDLRRVEAWLAI